MRPTIRRHSRARPRQNSTPIRSPNCSTSASRSAKSPAPNRSTIPQRSARRSGRKTHNCRRARSMLCARAFPAAGARLRASTPIPGSMSCFVFCSKPTARWCRCRLWSKAPPRRLDPHLRKAPSAPCCCVSRSRCLSLNTMTNGKISNLNSIRTNCSAANQAHRVAMLHDRPRFLLTRRRSLALGALAGGLVLLQRHAKALVRLDITEGNFQPLPIAIPKFFATGQDDGDAANAVTQIVTANLQRSGLFAPIDPTAYIERIASVDAVPRFPDWRNINAQALVTGRIGRQADGRLQAEFRLWDVLGGQQLDGKQYITTPDNWRRIAHIISDAIYERLTGQGGYFDSRVVFIDETGPPERRVKRLAIMDQDGANVRYLTRGDDLVLTPRFSPSTQEITYMAYGQGDPRVYLYNIETSQREIVGNFPGMSFAPRFSPDGQRVIMSLQEGGNSNLFVMDLRSKTTTRLTDTQAIDTAPSY